MSTQNLINKIPTIDLTTETLKPGSSSWSGACKDVQKAFEEYGCFIAIHDQFSSDPNNQFFKTLQDLFNLPLETKMQNASSGPLFGYKRPSPTMPLYEGFGFMGAPDMAEIQSFSNKIWPTTNENFCEIVHFFSKKLSELEHLVSRMLFESYGVEKHLDSHLRSLTYLTRFAKYRVPQENETNIGLNPHSDKSFISILHENEVSGLEIKTKQGNWVAVDLPPSSLLFLAGDSLKAWSNGKTHPAVHRVRITGKEERYSMVQFAYPKAGKLVDTVEEFIDEDHPRRYKPFDIYEYLSFYRLSNWSLDDDVLQAYCGI